ncbi:MAG TPA: redoxin domain-containing protein [Gaiellaceae bacterium]|nr:redoxin domain-containing protein [Gaiellaceae bacterium]
MRADLVVGNPFPDIRLPETTGRELALSEIAAGRPLALAFVRGWWCPKEQVRVRGLVALQEEIQREYGRIAAVTVDEPYVNGAFRAGIGAQFPFLSDEDRAVARELDLLELTDEWHLPYLPFTFLLDTHLRIEAIWCGFWSWGNPTPDELRLGFREITRREQPSFEPQKVWADPAAPAAGIDGDVIWIRENSRGHELWRGVHDGPVPQVGDTLGHSSVDGRPWVVRRIDRAGDRVAIHVSKDGKIGSPRLVGHHVTAPPSVR